MERRQKTTETDDRRWALSTQQEAAADLLAAGATVTDIVFGLNRRSAYPLLRSE